MAGACTNEEAVKRRTDEQAITNAKALVSSQLRDPASANFSQIEVRDGAVCGLVRGKNGFGVYAEPRRFVAAHGKATLAPSPAPGGPEPNRALLLTEQCIFEVDYRTCRGEEGLSSLERCFPSIEATRETPVSENEAKRICLDALERRFQQDIRPGQLKAMSSRTRAFASGYWVRITWEANGHDYSGISAVGECTVDSNGSSMVLSLME